MKIFEKLFFRHPKLKVCEKDIIKAFNTILACYKNGGKVLVCGNGGSAADAEHIVCELMKRVKKNRPVKKEVAARLPHDLTEKLEGALPAVSLVSMTGILSAFANDVSWETAFAQQVYALGNENDVLIAISTSGNSVNCINAALVAKAKDMKVVTLTGRCSGRLHLISDVTIAVPEEETYKVQELHLPVYHALCASLESHLFN